MVNRLLLQLRQRIQRRRHGWHPWLWELKTENSTVQVRSECSEKNGRKIMQKKSTGKTAEKTTKTSEFVPHAVWLVSAVSLV
jgi:hypothetical protein